MTAASGLTGRALNGLRWNYVGMVGRIAATFISQIALARLLGPEPFGQFGYAFLTMTMLALVIEMGLQSALVQTPNLRPADVATAFGRLLVAGAIAAVAVVLLADVIAVQIFAAPQAAPVLRAMAPTLLVGAATAVATASLSRDIEFKVIQLAGLGSYVVGYLVCGVVAAAQGLGVWSLVIAWHVQTVLACAAMLWCSPQRLWPGNPFRALGIAGFGAVVMVTNMINWVIDNGPHVAIGRWLGATALGQYTVSNNLVKVPADHLVRSLQAVLFPLASRAKDNDAGLKRAYLTVLAGVALVAFPLFGFIAVMAGPIVALLLGSKWHVAAEILAPLAVAMIGHAIEALCGPVLGGRGEPKVELRVKVVTLLVMLAVLSWTSSWSLAAVGWGVAAVYLFRWIWMNAAVMNRLSIAVGEIARALLGPLAVAMVCCAIAWATQGIAGQWTEPPPPLAVVATAALVASLSCLALLQLLPNIVLGPQLLWLLTVMVQRRPGIVRVPGLRRVVAAAVQQAG